MNDPRLDGEDAQGYYRRLQAAVEELMVGKGVFSHADVDREIAVMEARTPARGAQVVARAWLDPAFKARLLADGRAACDELGLAVGPLHLIVVENTPSVHNVIVCTLCSCYPRTLLGMPPAWYKSREYRARVVREPRKVLDEFGLTLPGATQIRVHDSSADMRYMVLPMRPVGTDGLSEAALADLVSGEALVGVDIAG
jgi:nitrile hydratase subunit alpha